MDEYICFLITLLCHSDTHGDSLVRCALKAKRSDLPEDCDEYPMEPENRNALYALLPSHVRSNGPIVMVESLEDVYVSDKCNDSDYGWWIINRLYDGIQVIGPALGELEIEQENYNTVNITQKLDGDM